MLGMSNCSKGSWSPDPLKWIERRKRFLSTSILCCADNNSGDDMYVFIYTGTSLTFAVTAATATVALWMLLMYHQALDQRCQQPHVVRCTLTVAVRSRLQHKLKLFASSAVVFLMLTP